VGAAGWNSGDGKEVSGNRWRLELLWILEQVFEGLVGRGCKRRMELGSDTPMVTGGGARRGRTGVFAREGGTTTVL
jgi:hypothetical protein